MYHCILFEFHVTDTIHMDLCIRHMKRSGRNLCSTYKTENYVKNVVTHWGYIWKCATSLFLYIFACNTKRSTMPFYSMYKILWLCKSKKTGDFFGVETTESDTNVFSQICHCGCYISFKRYKYLGSYRTNFTPWKVFRKNANLRM